MEESGRESGFESNWAVEPVVGLPVLDPEDIQWSIQMWFGGCGTSLEILYAMVAPFTEPTRQWIIKGLDSPLTTTAIIGGEWGNVSEFLTSLEDGRTLGQAALDSDFPEAPSEIAKLALRDSRALYGHGSVLQEPLTLAGRNPTNQLAISPSSDFPVAVRNLCLLDKRAILADENGDMDRNQVRELLEALSECTNFDFTSGDIERLGNLEVFHCLGAGAHEECFVKIKTSKESIRVKAIGGFTSDSGSLLMRCKQEARGHILRDMMIPVRLVNGGGSATFDTMESGPYSATIEIWANLDDFWYLVWRKSFTVIRSINFAFRVIGSRYALQSPWLERYSGSRTLADRASRIREIERYETESIRTGERADEPIVVSHVNAMALHSELFHPATDAMWLDKMRGDVDTPRLELVEWFRKVCDTAASITIVDPYFDSWGLELVARLEQLNLDVTVLSSENVRRGDASALQRLKSHVSQFNSLLHRGFCLCIVPDGKIHDRYLLIEKRNGDRLGYHFSNSFQHATQNYPLLITPIPRGVLESVWTYTETCESDAKAAISPSDVEGSIPRASTDVGPPGSFVKALEDFRASTVDEIGRRWEHLSEHLARTPADAEQTEAVRDAIREVGPSRLVSALAELPLEDDTRMGDREGRAQNAVRWTRMDFREAIENDRIERLGFEPSRSPWWLAYAAEFLAKYFPRAFKEWVDAEVDTAGSEDAANCPRKIVLYRLRQEMIRSTNIEWAALCPDRPNTRALITLLLDSDYAAIRALAAISSLQPSEDVDAEVLAEVRKLDATESIAAHEWLISKVLQEHAQNNEDEKIPEILTLASESLLFHGLSDAELQAIVERLASKVTGSVYHLIDEHLIAKTRKTGEDTVELHAVWVRMFSTRIGDEGRFMGWQDARLTELSAWYVAKLPAPRTATPLAEIRREIARCSRVLKRQFPRSGNYSGWTEARERVRWIQAFARAAVLNAVEDPETEHTIEGILEDARAALGRECDVEPAGYVSDLDMFSSAVREAYSKRD